MPSNGSVPNGKHLDTKLHAKQEGPGRTENTPKDSDAKSTSKSTSTVFNTSTKLLAVCSLVSAVIWTKLPNPTVALPKTYALCSPNDSSMIYAVDSQNSRVQCIFVHDTRIADSGNLGTFTFSHFPCGIGALTYVLFLETISTRWRERGQASNLGAAQDVLFGNVDIPTFFIPEGAIVVPGMSGTCAKLIDRPAPPITPHYLLALIFH